MTEAKTERPLALKALDEVCPICHGDCAGADAPVLGCPRRGAFERGRADAKALGQVIDTWIEGPGGYQELIRAILAAGYSRAGADREAELVKALEAAAGYMANANIGLAVGTKAQAAKVLDEGQRLIRAALSPQEQDDGK